MKRGLVDIRCGDKAQYGVRVALVGQFLPELLTQIIELHLCGKVADNRESFAPVLQRRRVDVGFKRRRPICTLLDRLTHAGVLCALLGGKVYAQNAVDEI